MKSLSPCLAVMLAGLALVIAGGVALATNAEEPRPAQVAGTRLAVHAPKQVRIVAQTSTAHTSVTQSRRYELP